MKRLILTLSLLVTVVAGALAQNDAVYVYRNDGKFDAFFKSEIDSMSYSHYDVDSIYHNDWQAQMVYTADSVYYIPLEAIDSISFTAPETKYSHDVVKLDKLIPYLKNVDGMVLTFDNSLPSYLKPQVGDVLLYEGYDNPMFEQGFAGRVSSVDNYDVTCDSVNLSEVYEQLICFGEYMAVEEPEPNSGVSKMRLVPKRAAGQVTSSIAIKGTVGSMNSLYLAVDGTLKFDLRVVSKIIAFESPYIDVSLTPSFSATLQGGIKGNFQKNILEKKVKVFGLPIPDTPFYVYISSGPVIEPSLNASVTTSTGVNFGFKLGMRYENNNWHLYGYNVSKGFSTPEISGNIEGSVFTGIGTEVGISSYGDLIKFYIEKKLGVELSANLSMDLLESNKYEELSKAKVDFGFVGDISANASLKLTPNTQLKGVFKLFSTKVGINSWKLLPSFSVPEVTDTKPTSAKITVTPTENLLTPVSIGIGLLDNDNNLTECTYLSPDYRLEKDSKGVDYSYEFCKLKSNEKYIACPMVKWNGIEFKATPHKDFTLDEIKSLVEVQSPSHWADRFIEKISYASHSNEPFWRIEFNGSSSEGPDEIGGGILPIQGSSNSIPLNISCIRVWMPNGFINHPTDIDDVRYYYREEGGEIMMPSDFLWSQLWAEPYPITMQLENLTPSKKHTLWIEITNKLGVTFKDSVDFCSCPKISLEDYVDMGTGILWSTKNVGADKYYELGKFGQFLEGQDAGRLPSEEDYKNLFLSCDVYWGNFNKVNGYFVIASNGNSLFLPVAETTNYWPRISYNVKHKEWIFQEGGNTYIDYINRIDMQAYSIRCGGTENRLTRLVK